MAVSSSSSSTVSNIFSSLGVKNKGIGGLSSGLDTDSLMEAMTLGTRQKIAKQQQQKQLLNWKMSAYRSTASALSSFKNKYFSFSASSSQNLLSTAFYNAFKTSSSSSKVSIVSTGSSTPTDFSIDQIHQLATSQSITAKESLASALTGSAVSRDTDFTGKTLSLNVDGAVRVIKLDSLNTAAAEVGGVPPTDAEFQANFEAEFQKLLNDAFGLKNNTSGDKRVVKAKMDTDGRLTLSADTSKLTVAVKSEELGFASGQTNRLDSNTQLKNIAAFGEKLAGDVFTFKINEVELTLSGEDTLGSLISKVNSSTANVRVSYSAITDTFSITSKVTGAGDNIRMEDVRGNLLGEIFGAKSSDELAAKQLAHNDGVVSLDTYAKMSKEEKLAFVKNYDGRSFDLAIGNTKSTVTLRFSSVDGLSDQVKGGEPPTLQQLASALNSGIASAFTDTATRKGVQFTVSDNTLVLKGNDNVPVTLSVNKSSTSRDFLGQMGFAEGLRTNVPDLSEAANLNIKVAGHGIAAGAYTVDVDGAAKSIVIDADTTVADLQQQFEDAGLTLAVKDGRLVLDTKGLKVADGAQDGVLRQMFGVSAYQSSAQNYEYVDEDGMTQTRVTAGQNAEITLSDGTLIVNANNTFDLYGARITLNAASEAGDAPIRLTVESNPDDLVDRIKGFIDDYNTMVETLNTLIYEEKNADYTPLSDEQKAQMSAEEIEKWEIEAKKGLLRSDSTLRDIVNQMRSVFYDKMESIGLAAYDLGITTKSMEGNLKNNGKIELTDQGIEKLRQAVEQNPDAVREVFTNGEKGVAVKLNEILDKAVNTSSLVEKRGSLVRLAGTDALTADNTSSLGNQISTIDQRLSSLKLRLESEYNRYWKQFSSLETALQRLNAQSSWLTSQS